VPDPAELPARLAAFVRDNVDSLEQLELLALVMKAPDRWWDAASVAAELRMSTGMARLALEGLATRNLMAISLTTDIRYRFQPGTSTLRDDCEAFAEAYRTNPVAMLRFVTDTQRRAIRDFADAFRLRRHDDR